MPETMQPNPNPYFSHLFENQEPHWLTVEAVREAHAALLQSWGGLEGERSTELLESALGRPKLAYHLGVRDVFSLAASYTESIVCNHPFLDGNKRTGFVAAYVFLRINGVQLMAPEDEVVEKIVALAAGSIKADELSTWLSYRCIPAQDTPTAAPSE